MNKRWVLCCAVAEILAPVGGRAVLLSKLRFSKEKAHTKNLSHALKHPLFSMFRPHAYSSLKCVIMSLTHISLSQRHCSISYHQCSYTLQTSSNLITFVAPVSTTLQLYTNTLNKVHLNTFNGNVLSDGTVISRKVFS